MNKNIIRWWLAVLIISFSSTILAAPKGICTSDNGVFHSTLNFSGYLITANQNKVGSIFNTRVTNGASYPGHCHCDTGNIGRYPYIYYTARINDALSYAGVHSSLNYYNLNPNLDVGIAIDILGVGMVNAPFEYQANRPSTSYDCSRTSPLNVSSGATAQIYFYIKKTFAGKIVIPETRIVSLYGTISRDTPVDYSQPMADVYIRGDITAPQSCEINSLQPIYFDFEDIPAADFSSVAGSAVTTHKITKTVTIECENLGLLNTDDITTSFYATESSTDNSMVVTSNPNVGVKIYDKNNKEIKVNGGELSTDMGKTTVYGEKAGNVTFSAAPASLTGARPAPGTFTATATITIEIVR
ncbi:MULTISPECIES: fimbrial protein [Escherichia]|uniref:Fimbrial protein n=1 Tax=Escherichia whittamii TaxID=2762229 RepID=A0ABR8TDT6_9ESCH|nr:MULTISPECIES: fimbrial protein [Escherichia]EEZ4384125.1 fimbrial protein [Escherichia coli]MBD7973759.1 fimbrial protein [Escherichia whittamii]MCA4892981.1 fimbrial protein [Escherichia whittamii]MEC9496794.1 fimbrial protein [Escherichia whittamii]MEC9561721.1 fimbrial protein [Escherichia whittamii]